MTHLTIGKILSDKVQQFLGGSEVVLLKTIMDLTQNVEEGKSSVTIPRVAGLTLKDVASGGNRQTAGGMSSDGDVLSLNQVKEVPEYISYKDGKEAAINLKKAFTDAAPAVYGQGVEKIIAAELAKVLTANKLTAKIDGSDIVAVIAKAKKTLDKLKVPKTGRFLSVDADGMEILAGTQAFQDGSKSLSAEALKLGVVSQIKGFSVVQSEDVERGATDKVQMCAYHSSHVAFALQGAMEFIDKDIEEYGECFLSLRGKYGSKVLDSGNRGCTITLNVA